MKLLFVFKSRTEELATNQASARFSRSLEHNIPNVAQVSGVQESYQAYVKET